MIFLAQLAGQFMAFGVSTDTKPAPTSGNGFIELDTGHTFRGNGSQWIDTTPSGGGGPTAWGGIGGTLSNQTDLAAALAAKANLSHGHIIADTTGLQTALNGKSDTGHTHTIANVTALQTALDAKANLDVYADLGTGLSLAFATNSVVKVTPSATGTFTTTVPTSTVDRRRTLIILQNNTTAKTMTFGTGFKPVGTLALGTVANRVFVVNFVSDGTNLYEAGRTAAMVA